jgi:hypothetical protein
MVRGTRDSGASATPQKNILFAVRIENKFIFVRSDLCGNVLLTDG